MRVPLNSLRGRRFNGPSSSFLAGKEKRKESFRRCFPARKFESICSAFVYREQNSIRLVVLAAQFRPKSDAFSSEFLPGKENQKESFRRCFPARKLEAWPSKFLPGKETGSVAIFVATSEKTNHTKFFELRKLDVIV
jgi:hypothetical protein